MAQMEAYEGLAQIYDIFMDEIDYDQWVSYLEEIWNKFGVQPERITDLGCGTGSVLIRLAKKGYTMTGIDLSEEMLAMADQKCQSEELPVALYGMDMCEFSLPEEQDAIISLMDCMNYLTEEVDLSAAFTACKENLRQGGLLIFDMNTEYRFREVYGQNTYASTTEDAVYIWENYYDEEEQINEYAVNLFQKEMDGRYSRSEEFHYEKAYAPERVVHLLNEAGLTLLALYDGYTFDAPTDHSERIFFVATKK